MIRLGIIGSDNSHAEVFSQMLNIPDAVTGNYAYPDCRVVGIFGLDKERTEQVARDGKIDFIAEKAEDLLGKVDAVMVVFRHGGLHYQYAMPFIKAGIPVWVDKPFAIDQADARAMISASKEKNTLITGGSTCKYTYDVQMANLAVLGNSRIGKFRTGVINFPAELNSEYGGIFFYGGHLSEMTLASFGWDMKTVYAREKDGLVTVIAGYDQYQITMNFIPNNGQYYAVLYGDNGVITREIDISICYKLGFQKFYEMLITKVMPVSYENLFKPVALLNAIKQSYETKQEVSIEEL